MIGSAFSIWVGLSMGLLDMSGIYAAKSRADLVARRSAVLTHFLDGRPAPDEEFVSNLSLLSHTPVEGREDLAWTIEVFEIGRAYLRKQKATPIVESRLLQEYAGAVQIREQFVQARRLLRESLSLLPTNRRQGHSLRCTALKQYAEVLANMGDTSGAETALEEASALDADPTEVTHTLWFLAEHYAANQKPVAAEKAILRLASFLSSRPEPPHEALVDGWARVAMFYEERGDARKAVSARWKLVHLTNSNSPEEVLGQLEKVYEAAGSLDDAAREATAQETLRAAEDKGGAALRTSLLFELAGTDIVQLRPAVAQERMNEASRAVARLGDQASRQDRAQWHVRTDDLLRSLARQERGDKISTTKPMIRFLDANGDPITSPEPPPQDPLQDIEKLLRSAPEPKSETEAAELLSRLAAGKDLDLRAALRELLPAGPGNPIDRASIRERMTKLIAAPPAEMDGNDWASIHAAIRDGEHALAESFLHSQLEREVNGFAHPFDIQQLVYSLLDALEQSQSWEKGRQRLRWWRDLVGKIDHPESARLFENFEVERKWEDRAGNSETAKRIWAEYVSFAEKTLGANHKEVARIRSRANR